MAAISDPANLLQRYKPLLRYDSQEPYFADAASVWTDNPGNQLRRADGTVVATASPSVGQPRLSLAFLGPTHYTNGQTASAGDRIADASHNYVAQAHAMHGQPRHAHRIHGHHATGGDGRLRLP